MVVHLHDYWLPNILHGGSESLRPEVALVEEAAHRAERPRDLRLTSMLAVSGTLRDRYVEAGFSADMIEVIPYGLRLPSIERQRGPALDGELRLLFVGRLDPEKGAHLLLNAWRSWPEATGLASAATWPGRPARQSTCAACQLIGDDALRGSVRLLGSIERDRLLRLYAGYDAAVVPSLWQEPFSLVVPEALAAGTAVVASRRVGAADWFEDGRELLLFSPQAPESSITPSGVYETSQRWPRGWQTPEAARLGRSSTGRVLDRLESHLQGAVGKPKLSPLLAGARGAAVWGHLPPRAKGGRHEGPLRHPATALPAGQRRQSPELLPAASPLPATRGHSGLFRSYCRGSGRGPGTTLLLRGRPHGPITPQPYP